MPKLNVKSVRVALAIGLVSCSGAAVADAPDIEMWRLDCGQMIIDDISYFSDAFYYDGQSATLDNGCYLVRNGERYLLWDAGLPREVLGNTTPNHGWTSSIRVTIADQLDDIGLDADDIDFVGTSHFHGDHIGQAAEFSGATLLIGKGDAEWIRENPPGNARRRLAPWFEEGAAMEELSGDHDVFGDGAVTILAMPGHTPGHGSLLVRLPETGPVLLSGDLYKFSSEIGEHHVSLLNTSRAETLASIERFTAIIENIDPVVIVQHDPADTGKLPAFPASAR